MRKLSDTQAAALFHINANGNAIASGAAASTLRSLESKGLIAGTPGGSQWVTTDGIIAYRMSTGESIHGERPVVETIGQAHALFPDEVGQAIGDLAPVFTEATEAMEKLAEVLPETREDGLLTDAAVSHLLKDAGIVDDPSRYDEFHVMENRADRRAQQKARASRNRAAMRRRRQPARRQVRATTPSQGLKLGDALRTADGPGMVIGVSLPEGEYDRTGRPVTVARVQLADRSERTVDFHYGEKLRLLV